MRWGRQYAGPVNDGAKTIDEFVWVFEISGAVPPAHLIGGYAGTVSERQPPMYFPLGGGTVKGVSKPGWIVWSRVFVENGKLEVRHRHRRGGEAARTRPSERWKSTTAQWPIMSAVLPGVSRDQMMARHKANHIQVAYAPDKAGARKAMFAKAAAMKELGLDVSFCGEF